MVINVDSSRKYRIPGKPFANIVYNKILYFIFQRNENSNGNNCRHANYFNLNKIV